MERESCTLAVDCLLEAVLAGAPGQVRGDRPAWHPLLCVPLAPAGIAVCAPYRPRGQDPDPVGRHGLGRVRWRIETVVTHPARLPSSWRHDKRAHRVSGWRLG